VAGLVPPVLKVPPVPKAPLAPRVQLVQPVRTPRCPARKVRLVLRALQAQIPLSLARRGRLVLMEPLVPLAPRPYLLTLATLQSWGLTALSIRHP
jgi:hypothetical protein